MFRILKVNLNCSQKANLLSDIAFRWNICTYLTSGVVKSEKKGEFRLTQFIEQILIFFRQHLSTRCSTLAQVVSRQRTHLPGQAFQPGKCSHKLKINIKLRIYKQTSVPACFLCLLPGSNLGFGTSGFQVHPVQAVGAQEVP